ncbi:MAG TPA: phenylalanine--tRNA ligase subunit alpha [Polyangiaceae bacterium]|nr:phenylalanine--tRNA ligase subunit alpha [Polyangiaceae bacterium]
MSDAAAEIEAGLAALGEQFRAAFSAATTAPDLRAAKARFLGKKGELTAVLKRLGEVPGPDRKRIGERVNGTKEAVEKAFDARLTELAALERRKDLEGAPYDLTLPGRRPSGRGHVHPLTRVRTEILDIFQSLGFQIAWGPEVELESNNFEKLAFPPDHPAMDMQDSFWVKVQGAGDARTLLRTHTSSVQIREMSTRKPPMAVVSGGATYRRDDDVTHSPMFHQVEGFLVDERVTFAELRGVLTAFAERLYGRKLNVRFRPSYFPFVEPGAEMDVECVFCTESTRSSCRICKGTGWLEILGCGMIHPDVFAHCGIDPERYTGFAFGLGIERTTMLRYGIPDMRLLFENDPRFLAQF